MAEDKSFSISKWFFSLIPASGEQWGKWLDFIWKLAVVILIYIFIWLPFRDKYLVHKSDPTQSVGTNQGIIATKNEDKSGNSYSLLNFFNWK